MDGGLLADKRLEVVLAGEFAEEQFQQSGVADFGGVGRWLGELDSYSAFDGYAGPELSGLDEVANWLDANRPT